MKLIPAPKSLGWQVPPDGRFALLSGSLPVKTVFALANFLLAQITGFFKKKGLMGKKAKPSVLCLCRGEPPESGELDIIGFLIDSGPLRVGTLLLKRGILPKEEHDAFSNFLDILRLMHGMLPTDSDQNLEKLQAELLSFLEKVPPLQQRLANHLPEEAKRTLTYLARKHPLLNQGNYLDQGLLYATMHLWADPLLHQVILEAAGERQGYPVVLVIGGKGEELFLQCRTLLYPAWLQEQGLAPFSNFSNGCYCAVALGSLKSAHSSLSGKPWKEFREKIKEKLAQ